MGPSRRSESLYFAEAEKRYLSNTTEPYDPQVTRREQPERTARPSIQIQPTDCDITTKTVTTKRSDTSLAILIEDGTDLTVYRSSIGKYRTTGDQRWPEIPAPEKGKACLLSNRENRWGGILKPQQSIVVAYYAKITRGHAMMRGILCRDQVGIHTFTRSFPRYNW